MKRSSLHLMTDRVTKWYEDELGNRFKDPLEYDSWILSTNRNEKIEQILK